jgi:hypothetical protein
MPPTLPKAPRRRRREVTTNLDRIDEASGLTEERAVKAMSRSTHHFSPAEEEAAKVPAEARAEIARLRAEIERTG